MNTTQYAFLTKTLVDVAMGRKPADLVIRDGRWVNVQSGEIIPHTDIAVCGERIAYVGPDASHTIGEKTHVVDAGGKFLSPGFLDGHMHVESSMAIAANKLAETGGGQVVVKNGQVIGLVELPLAGLMSSEPAEIVAEKTEKVLEGFRACGCTLHNPNMQLSLLPLVVIPELRISD